MRYSQEEPVREIAHGMLFGSQFQHFIPEVAAQHSPTTSHTHMACSPSYDYHLEEMDHSYPVDAAGTSQAGPSQPSQYQSPPLPERHANASFYRRRRRRPTQLDKVDEGSWALTITFCVFGSTMYIYIYFNWLVYFKHLCIFCCIYMFNYFIISPKLWLMNDRSFGDESCRLKDTSTCNYLF